MARLWQWTGNLYDLMDPHWAGVLIIVASIICGALVGVERRARGKPAGLRTLILICMGSTIFTMGSLLIAGPWADPGRVAAQVVTGVGFLGAGVILRDRGSIIGLTTAATVWTIAAIGVVVGSGYAAAGIALALLVLGTLTLVRKLEALTEGPCEMGTYSVLYNTEGGKTRVRIMRLIDEFQLHASDWSIERDEKQERLRIRFCTRHPAHRLLLYRLVELPGIVEMRQVS